LGSASVKAVRRNIDEIDPRSIPYNLEMQASLFEEERAKQKREAEINAAIRFLPLETLFT